MVWEGKQGLLNKPLILGIPELVPVNIPPNVNPSFSQGNFVNERSNFGKAASIINIDDYSRPYPHMNTASYAS